MKSNNIETIPNSTRIKDFDGRQVMSVHFRDSWVSVECLDNHLKFDEFVTRKAKKDSEKDPFASENKVDHLIIITRDPEVSYLLSHTDARELIKNGNLKKYFSDYDFYLPRSLWWRSFLLLNG